MQYQRLRGHADNGKVRRLFMQTPRLVALQLLGAFAVVFIHFFDSLRYHTATFFADVLCSLIPNGV